jgi:hypothetical protein
MAETELGRLEQNAQRSRADLAETVDELRSRVSGTADDLRHRVSAEGLKEDLRQYVGRTRQEIVHTLKQRASENPLGAVAVGAGVAYVGWRILRTIPAPLLLLGGGLVLLKSGGQDGTGGTAAPGYGAPNDVGTGDERKSNVASGMETARARVGETAANAADAASRMASTAVSAVSDVASSAYQSGVRATAYAGDRAAQAGQRTQDIFVETFERHPLLVGSVGVAIGALIGASLPVTEAEQRLLGEKSDEIKERASRAASDGYAAAEAAGERIVKQAVGEATEPSTVSGEDQNAGRPSRTADDELEQVRNERRDS